MNRENIGVSRAVLDLNNQVREWKFKTKAAGYEIWQRDSDHKIAEAYPIPNALSVQRHLRAHKLHVVKMLGLTHATKQHRAYILVERLPNRLSECVSLNQTQSLKILYSIFKGLEELRTSFGVIGLVEGCVFFSQKGKIKIWVNPDLRSDIPIRSYNSHEQKSQRISIWESIEMIEKKCFNEQILSGLKKSVKSGKIRNYSDACRQAQKLAECLFIDLDQKVKNKPQNISIQEQIKSTPTSKHKALNTVAHNLQSKIKNGQKHTSFDRINDIMGFLKDKGYVKYFQQTAPAQNFTKCQRKRHTTDEIVEGRTDTGGQFFKNTDTDQNTNKFERLNWSRTMDAKFPGSDPQSPRQIQTQNVQTQMIGCSQEKRLPEQTNPGNTVKNPIIPNKLQPSGRGCAEKEFQDSFSHNLAAEASNMETVAQFQTFGMIEELSDNSLQQTSTVKRNKTISQGLNQDNSKVIDRLVNQNISKKNEKLQNTHKAKHTRNKSQTYQANPCELTDQKLGTAQLTRELANFRSYRSPTSRDNFYASARYPNGCKQASESRDQFWMIDRKYEKYVSKKSPRNADRRHQGVKISIPNHFMSGTSNNSQQAVSLETSQLQNQSTLHHTPRSHCMFVKHKVPKFSQIAFLSLRSSEGLRLPRS